MKSYVNQTLFHGASTCSIALSLVCLSAFLGEIDKCMAIMIVLIMSVQIILAIAFVLMPFILVLAKMQEVFSKKVNRFISYAAITGFALEIGQLVILYFYPRTVNGCEETLFSGCKQRFCFS
jgi:hypothetical protein